MNRVVRFFDKTAERVKKDKERMLLPKDSVGRRLSKLSLM